MVKEVRASSRLADSPSCIIADENDPTIQLQQMMKALGQKDLPEFKPILEVNPNHEIMKKLQADSSDKALLEDVSYLLLEQAFLVEGAPLKKPAEFVSRLESGDGEGAVALARPRRGAGHLPRRSSLQSVLGPGDDVVLGLARESR